MTEKHDTHRNFGIMQNSRLSFTRVQPGMEQKWFFYEAKGISALRHITTRLSNKE